MTVMGTPVDPVNAPETTTTVVRVAMRSAIGYFAGCALLIGQEVTLNDDGKIVPWPSDDMFPPIGSMSRASSAGEWLSWGWHEADDIRIGGF